MKQKTAYIIIFSFLSFSSIFGQSLEETYLFANQLFDQGEYKSAILEFQRIAFFDTDNKYNDVYEKTGDAFYFTEDFDKAIHHYNIASKLQTNDSIKNEIIFKKALGYFKKDKYFFALNELLSQQSPNNSYQLKKYHLFLSISYFGIEDYNTSLSFFNKIITHNCTSELSNIFHEFEKFQKRYNFKKIQKLSMIPGLGQIYCGNVLSGVNSILLLGGISALSLIVWQNYGIFDAFLSMSSWSYRYYSGGLRNAKEIAINKINHEKENVYQEIMKIIEENLTDNKE